MIGSQVLNAQQEPIKRMVLLKTDLLGIEGKEGLVMVVEIVPGGALGKHYHPGHQFVYILEGSLILEVEGKPPITFKSGEVSHELPKQIHNARNPSTTAPAKALVFVINDKVNPLSSR